MSTFHSNPAFEVVETPQENRLEKYFRLGEYTVGASTDVVDMGVDLILEASPRFLSREQVSRVVFVVHTKIETFAPEPYRLKKLIPVVVAENDLGCTASHYESNTHASGENEIEALENLKSLILDTFDILDAERKENPGPRPLRQIAVLREHIERA